MASIGGASRVGSEEGSCVEGAASDLEEERWPPDGRRLWKGDVHRRWRKLLIGRRIDGRQMGDVVEESIDLIGADGCRVISNCMGDL
ncbi:unnamed protein product [Cuscuta campestris]|uniref:Uncharacterized protein n=1 Tax=Cuscuta campestris TaxID=132261 RepID=A0A484LW22_9ASTE|nr:unnamed protein product [Cuscuta campestris]